MMPWYEMRLVYVPGELSFIWRDFIRWMYHDKGIQIAFRYWE